MRPEDLPAWLRPHAEAAERWAARGVVGRTAAGAWIVDGGAHVDPATLPTPAELAAVHAGLDALLLASSQRGARPERRRGCVDPRRRWVLTPAGVAELATHERG